MTSADNIVSVTTISVTKWSVTHHWNWSFSTLLKTMLRCKASSKTPPDTTEPPRLCKYKYSYLLTYLPTGRSSENTNWVSFASSENLAATKTPFQNTNNPALSTESRKHTKSDIPYNLLSEQFSAVFCWLTISDEIHSIKLSQPHNQFTQATERGAGSICPQIQLWDNVPQ